ncbi:aTP-dependent helicase, DEAD/DEAH family [Burkholderia pseudomallei MSHR435]|nr:aTP-dependent helicase, DEAD/DEAH family [Burkholderia pseudomallei MSHR435]
MRERVAHEIVERGQECGERLAGARRRGDERRAAGLDVRPRERLRAGGRGERVGEPGGDDGVERVERAGGRAGGSGVHR